MRALYFEKPYSTIGVSTIVIHTSLTEVQNDDTNLTIASRFLKMAWDVVIRLLSAKDLQDSDCSPSFHIASREI